MMVKATDKIIRDKIIRDKKSRGESEVFDKARLLVDAALKLFPHADPEDLKRTCEAALDIAIEESRKE